MLFFGLIGCYKWVCDVSTPGGLTTRLDCYVTVPLAPPVAELELILVKVDEGTLLPEIYCCLLNE